MQSNGVGARRAGVRRHTDAWGVILNMASGRGGTRKGGCGLDSIPSYFQASLSTPLLSTHRLL
jgi:hypothetical protein